MIKKVDIDKISDEELDKWIEEIENEPDEVDWDDLPDDERFVDINGKLISVAELNDSQLKDLGIVRSKNNVNQVTVVEDK